MRKRPSASMAVALVALFFSLTGTALAAALITSNNQVAAHVISGANGPAGDTKNLIPGSVGTADLHAAAVTADKLAPNSVDSSKVVANSLRGADIKESTLDQVPSAANGATKIDFQSSADDSTFTPIATIGHLTIGGQCQQSMVAILRVESDVVGSLDDTFVTWFNEQNTSSAYTNSMTLNPGTPATIAVANASTPNVDRTQGQFVYRDAQNVISVIFDIVADGNTNTCSITGTAFGTS
jgi:hypothetical protein